MRNTRYFIISFVLVYIFIWAKFPADREVESVESRSGLKAEVELLIVCDKEFSDIFGNSRQKMIDYWAAYMSDVSRRFGTLEGVQISFRITSLISINDKLKQPFIENVRNEFGTISKDDVYEKFGQWVRIQAPSLPGFDVALLVTGASLNLLDGFWSTTVWHASACLEYNISGTNTSTIVLFSSAAWGYDCVALESAFAVLLGARDDKVTTCESDQYLMGKGPCDDKQYVFSSCSDDDISKFIKSDQASCLRVSSAPGVNVLKSSTVTHPPSINGQCKMVTNNTNAVASNDCEDCVKTSCSFWGKGKTYESKRSLYPLDNSPCGNGTGSFCYRGKCSPRARYLQHVQTGKCLDAIRKYTDLGVVNVVKMVHCSDTTSPPSEFFLKSVGTTVAISLLKYNACLSSESYDSDTITFVPCESIDKSPFLFMLESSIETIFSICRYETKTSCITVDENGMLKLDTEIVTEPHFWVQYDPPPVVSFDWFSDKYNVASKLKISAYERNLDPVANLMFRIFVVSQCIMFVFVVCNCFSLRSDVELTEAI